MTGHNQQIDKLILQCPCRFFAFVPFTVIDSVFAGLTLYFQLDSYFQLDLIRNFAPEAALAWGSLRTTVPRKRVLFSGSSRTCLSEIRRCQGNVLQILTGPHTVMLKSFLCTVHFIRVNS